MCGTCLRQRWEAAEGNAHIPSSSAPVTAVTTRPAWEATRPHVTAEETEAGTQGTAQGHSVSRAAPGLKSKPMLCARPCLLCAADTVQGFRNQKLCHKQKSHEDKQQEMILHLRVLSPTLDTRVSEAEPQGNSRTSRKLSPCSETPQVCLQPQRTLWNQKCVASLVVWVVGANEGWRDQ